MAQVWEGILSIKPDGWYYRGNLCCPLYRYLLSGHRLGCKFCERIECVFDHWDNGIAERNINASRNSRLVLMIGMGVDANVLIYERIREERAKGKPIRAAVKAGYQKAFSAIFDSNITTLITGVILASVGTGPVKGFAWILIIGLIINLFTAIFVTRTIYELLMDLKWVKSFSMLRLIGVPDIRFLSIRHILFIVSGVCVLGGMTFFVIRGDKSMI